MPVAQKEGSEQKMFRAELSPTRGRGVQLPLMSIVEDGLQPLVIVVSVVFHVAAMAEDVHLPGSHNTTFRTFIEDGHRR